MDTSETIVDIDPNKAHIANRRRCIWLFYGLSAYWGVAQVISPDSEVIYFSSAILFASVATSWALLDSRIIERRMPSSVPMVFFILWPVASLGYLLWTRGWRGSGLWALHVAGLSATILLTFYPTILILYWLGVIEIAADGTLQTGN